MKKQSKNKLAEKIVGLRSEYLPKTHYTILDFPCELGFHCPKCKYKQILKSNYDERLRWSEYQGFIWCSICNFDYPSAICMPNSIKATEIYLIAVKEAINRNN